MSIQGKGTIFTDQLPNFQVYKIKAYNSGTQIFNSLPLSLKFSWIKKAQFKVALETYIPFTLLMNVYV
jgi:hypothetical protein